MTCTVQCEAPVPDSRRIRLVNVIFMCRNVLWVGGWAMGERATGRGGGSQKRQLALSKGLARIGIRCHVQRAAMPSKGSFIFPAS
jgi:hypothetical protein